MLLNASILRFYALVMCQNFFPELPDSHRGILVHRWLSKSIFHRDMMIKKKKMLFGRLANVTPWIRFWCFKIPHLQLHIKLVVQIRLWHAHLSFTMDCDMDYPKYPITCRFFSSILHLSEGIPPKLSYQIKQTGSHLDSFSCFRIHPNVIS